MPTRVACSVAMEMRVTEALIVKTKAEDIVERIRKNCAAFQWKRYVSLILVAAVPNLFIYMQLCPLMYLWTGLLRVQPLHFPLSTEDQLIKESKWLLFLLFLPNLYGQFTIKCTGSYAHIGAKLLLILPYHILATVVLVLLVNHDYQLIVPSGCLFDEAKNSTIADATIFTSNQTLTSCIFESFSATVRCERFMSYKLSVETMATSTTFWDTARKYIFLESGLSYALTQYISDLYFNCVYGQDNHQMQSGPLKAVKPSESLQVYMAIISWTALSRVDALNHPPSTQDVVMKELKWLLPLLFLLHLYGQFIFRGIRNYSQLAAKTLLILPYFISLITAWLLLINYDYKVIVPRGCSFDEAKNRTALDVTIFNTNQTLTSCITEIFPAAIQCGTYYSFKLSMELPVSAPTLLGAACKYVFCAAGICAALIAIVVGVTYDKMFDRDPLVRSLSLPLSIMFSLVVLFAMFSSAILPTISYCF